jgi:hypothetical protein
MPRRQVHARLDPVSAAAWDRWLTREGVTFSAVLEALGREIAEGRNPSKRVVRLARSIDRMRGSRR